MSCMRRLHSTGSDDAYGRREFTQYYASIEELQTTRSILSDSDNYKDPQANFAFYSFT